MSGEKTNLNNKRDFITKDRWFALFLVANGIPLKRAVNSHRFTFSGIDENDWLAYKREFKQDRFYNINMARQIDAFEFLQDKLK